MIAEAAFIAKRLRGLTRKRVSNCRLIRVAPEIQVIERQAKANADHSRILLRGIASCGSVHSCPMCAQKILTVRAQEITAAVEAHGHKRTGLITLTLKHAREHELYPQRRIITDAYSRLKGGVDGAAMRSRLHYVGDIRGAEQSHGENGWHPHLHAIWFFTAVDKEAIKAELAPAWRQAVARTFTYFENCIDRALGRTPREPREGCRRGSSKPLPEHIARKVFGGKCFENGETVEQAAEEFERMLETLGDAENVLPDEVHGVDVQTCEHGAVSRYIAKMGLEVSSVTKKRETKTRTSWQVARAAAEGEKHARFLWSEHARAMKGSRQLTWSRGLREKLGLEPERSDTELSVEAPTEDERLLGVIDGKAWDAEIWRDESEPAEAKPRRVAQDAIVRVHEAYAKGEIESIPGFVKTVTPFAECRPVVTEPRKQWWELWASEDTFRGKMAAPEFMADAEGRAERWWSRQSRDVERDVEKRGLPPLRKCGAPTFKPPPPRRYRTREERELEREELIQVLQDHGILHSGRKSTA